MNMFHDDDEVMRLANLSSWSLGILLLVYYNPIIFKTRQVEQYKSKK